MYFSVLPLLLLFASTVCASPVHVGRRMNNDATVPQFSLNNAPPTGEPPSNGPPITNKRKPPTVPKISLNDERPVKMDQSNLLPANHHDDKMYPKYFERFWNSGQEIKGLRPDLIALKIKYGDDIMVRIVTGNVGIRPVQKMIKDPNSWMVSWGWSDISRDYVAFTIRMKAGGEETLKKYLANEDLTQAMANTSLGSKHSG